MSPDDWQSSRGAAETKRTSGLRKYRQAAVREDGKLVTGYTQVKIPLKNSFTRVRTGGGSLPPEILRESRYEYGKLGLRISRVLSTKVFERR